MELSTTNQKIIFSADGTPIAVEQTGCGSPLILVHGTGADHTRWAAVLPRLAINFTVYSIDRRGRGESGDSSCYTVYHEFEDIAAVAASIPGAVDILGHSFGAACVLGAAAGITNLRRMVLYEPPMLREQQSPQRSEMIQRMDEALDTGDRETPVLIMMTEMLRIPMEMVNRVRGTAAWERSLSAAHTLPRELRSSDVYGANLDALKAISVPTLFLLGTESPVHFKETTETLLGLLPNSQVALLAGQQHSAMLTAPDLFAQEVTRFLLDPVG